MNKEVIKFLSCIVFCMVAINTYSQENLFSLDDVDRKHSSKWKVNKIFTETDTVKSFSNQNITGVAITGNFILSSQESYIRIILHADKTGEEYLVSESYSPKDVTKEKQQLIEYALETNSLYNIVSGTITIEINDAECEIEEILFSSKKYIKSSKLYKQEKKSHKAKQDSLIVRKIQSNLNRNNQKWVAGVNEFSRKTYSEKKNLLPKNEKGEIPNMQGFEYYVGGIFEIGGESSTTSVKSSTTYAADVDWRNRHGKNWITSIKSQQCNQCWVFTPVGTAEALVNVYYNRLINIDLSEQDVASCSGGNIGSCQGGFIGTSANYIVNTGVVNESCFPYVGQDEPNEPCSLVSAGGNKCNSPVERISFNSRKSLSRNVDSLKKALINYGPICGGISNWWHFMPIVGYGTIQAGDILVDGDVGSGTTITIPSGDPLIGETYWIFKNSWGTGWGNNGYGLVKVDISKIYGRYALTFPVNSLQYSTSDIQCLDLDGDGYYYWGLGSKPSTCPTCSLDEPDGDDSNPNLGPMDEYGNIQSITPHVYSTTYISSSQTWSTEQNLCGNLVVTSNSTLTITSKVTMPNHSEIIVQNGGKLIIDGGRIVNGNITVKNGCNLTIKNNGAVDKDFNDELEIELGATFDFDYGAFNQVTY